MSRTRRNQAAYKRAVIKHVSRNHAYRAVRIRPLTLVPQEFMESLTETIFTRPIFFDREGEPLSIEEYGVLHSFRNLYCRVDESTIGPLWVSTVWLGTDMGFGMSGPPVIFETMIFGDENDTTIHPELRQMIDSMARYCTADEAQAGHAAICVDIRQLLAKIEMAEAIHNDAIDHPLGHPCRACGELFHNHPNKECNAWY